MHSPHLTEIHDHTLMDLLPQVSPEYLDERDLESRDLSMHENTSQIKLHLETNIYLYREECTVRIDKMSINHA